MLRQLIFSEQQEGQDGHIHGGNSIVVGQVEGSTLLPGRRLAAAVQGTCVAEIRWVL